MQIRIVDLSIRLSTIKAKFAFSSNVSVKRYDLGKSMSPFESISQRIILDKFCSFLMDKDYHEALFKIKVREETRKHTFLHQSNGKRNKTIC